MSNSYSFTPIIVPADPQADAVEINNSDQVLLIGQSYPLYLASFLYDGKTGASTSVFKPSTASQIYNDRGVDMNSSGVVIGYIQDSNQYPGYFEESGGTYTQLNLMPPNFGVLDDPIAINDSGEVLGSYLNTVGYGYHLPFIYDGENYTIIRDPSAYNAPPTFDPADQSFYASTYAYDLNNSDEVVGLYLTKSASGRAVEHGFLYNGSYQTLDDPLEGPNGQTELLRINNAGQIIGRFQTSVNSADTYFLYSGSTYVTISDPLASKQSGSTFVNGMNDAGTVVGSYVVNGISHGFVFDNGIYTTVDNPAGVLKGGHGTVITGINDAGDLVGYTLDASNGTHSFTTVVPLFTAGANTVNFNNLNTGQKSAIANKADVYHGLGGSDVVTLPDVSNYNEIIGNGQTLDWTNTAASTFYTGSLAGNTYHVIGLDGSYFIDEGAGTEFVTINGNGNSNISAGSGSDTITIYGNGDNTISAGGGKDTITIIGVGNNTITAGSGPDTITISGTGSDTVTGKLSGSVSVFEGGTVELKGGFVGSATIGSGSTLQLDSTGSGGIVFQSNGREELTISGTTMPTSLISGFASGDIIDLASIPFDSIGGVTLFDSSAHVLDIFEGQGQNYQLDFAASQKLNSTATDDFTLSPDGKGGTDLTFATNWSGSTPSLTGKWSKSPGQPSLQNLADLASNVYNTDSSAVDGFNPAGSSLQQKIGSFVVSSIFGKKIITNENNVFTYLNGDSSQVVVAISGTNFGHENNYDGLKNVLTDIGSISTGVPTTGLLGTIASAYSVLARVSTLYPKAHITITGHSLGGAIAQYIGQSTGFDTVTFNAPGAGQLLGSTALTGALTAAGLSFAIAAITAKGDPNYLGQENKLASGEDRGVIARRM
jgi:hypothetical protein